MFDEPTNNDATQPVWLNSDGNQPKEQSSETESTSPVKITESTQPIQVSKPQTSAAAVTNTIPDPEAGAGKIPPKKPAGKGKKSGRGWWIVGGIVFVLLFAFSGGYLGYGAGIQERLDSQSNQVATAAATQFQLGLDDMTNGRYEMARGRFEYVIKLDPSFPGAKQKLTEVMLALIPTAVPTATLTPTPEFTPTPDMRGEEELYKQIQVQLAAQKWDTAIVTIESLRTKNLKYQTVNVDGFYYIALRYRGVDRILRQGDLEGGMYDLALAEQFGPLDRDADSYRLWARYYVTGASFWQVDWEKATYYFGQVAPMLPNLRDSSNIFAIDRYREAATRYAEKLATAGEYCKASELLDKIFINNYKNATFEPIATRAYRECHPPTDTPEPTKAVASPTPSPSPTRTLPGATTVVPTAGGTPTPPPPTATSGATATTAPAASPTTSAGPTATTAPSPTPKLAATNTVAPSPTPSATKKP